MNVMSVVAGLSKTAGGTSYTVPAWNNALAKAQIRCHLMTVQALGEELCEFVDEKLVHLEKVQGFNLPGLNIHWTPGFGKVMEKMAVENNIQLIHNHGAWLPANHLAVQMAYHKKIPCVFTAHGMLTLWAFNHKPLRKRMAWWFYQKEDIRKARVVHVTAQSEGDDLRKLGFQGTLAVIPNGLNLCEWKERKPRSVEYRTVLFVSRIHYKKGIMNLVQAWADLRPKGWKVKLVGPDEGSYQAIVERAIREKGLEEDFKFLGPVYGEALMELYRQSDLFVLPTLSENFANVVPEALSCGLPVLCTHGAPWEELNTRSCGWWFPVGVEPLKLALRQAMETTEEERLEMGKRGRRLVEEKYTWDSAAFKMKALYEWILYGGDVPAFVQVGNRSTEKRF